MRQLEFDTIVIGSGLAGLTAAFHSSRFGNVAIVTKSELDTSNSWFAQGELQPLRTRMILLRLILRIPWLRGADFVIMMPSRYWLPRGATG